MYFSLQAPKAPNPFGRREQRKKTVESSFPLLLTPRFRRTESIFVRLFLPLRILFCKGLSSSFFYRIFLPPRSLFFLLFSLITLSAPAATRCISLEFKSPALSRVYIRGPRARIPRPLFPGDRVELIYNKYAGGQRWRPKHI